MSPLRERLDIQAIERPPQADAIARTRAAPGSRDDIHEAVSLDPHRDSVRNLEVEARKRPLEPDPHILFRHAQKEREAIESAIDIHIRE